jgi:ribosomal protein S18 acetylase RimI-like enzyme
LDDHLDAQNAPDVIVERATTADRAWLEAHWNRIWGGDYVVSRGRIRHLDDVHAVIAWREGQRVGEATWAVSDDKAELVSISALQPGRGIGTALLAAVEVAVRAAGATRLWLITTNDNLNALRFYQRRGYNLRNLHTGSVEAARRVKGSIPLVGAHGIPIRDEIELDKAL